MESIAVTKPGMGVLSQERLLLSPFGALAQAFSQEILDRARKEEGRWSYVPLDLLEEGEESQTRGAGPMCPWTCWRRVRNPRPPRRSRR